MRNYKIAFVGLGSIATRHLKNVHAYLASQGDSCTVDIYRSSLGRSLAEELQPLVNKSYLYADENNKIRPTMKIKTPLIVPIINFFIISFHLHWCKYYL